MLWAAKYNIQDLLGHTRVTASSNSSRRNNILGKELYKLHLYALYVDEWINKLNNEQKMRTYTKIKSISFHFIYYPPRT